MGVHLMLEMVTEVPGEDLSADPEVRQARAIAEAARTQLLDRVSGQRGPVDLPEAARLLTALRLATALAEDAGDQVLVRRGLLTPAEAARQSAGRHAALDGPGRGPRATPGPAAPRQGRAARAALAQAALPRLFRDPRLFGDPRRTAVSGLAAAAAVASVGAAVFIARRRPPAALAA